MLYHHRLISNIAPTNNRVLYFDMNDTGDVAVDSIGNKELGKSGDVTNGVTGIKGTCWQAQNGGYLSAALSSNFGGYSYLTLNIWVYVTGMTETGANATVFQIGSYDGNDGYGFYMNNARHVAARVRQSWNWYGSTEIPLNTWTMLTMVIQRSTQYGGQRIFAYVNGVLNQTHYDAASIVSSKKIGAFCRASTGGSSSQYFEGRLDQVCLWNIAMTGQQVKALYDSYTKPVYIGGLDAFNHSAAFSSASLASCSSGIAPAGQLWGYYKGQLLAGNTVTATNTGVTADANGVYTLGGGKYFTFDQSVLTGDASRTFIMQATLSTGGKHAFIDAGSTAGGSRLQYFWWHPDQLYLNTWGAIDASISGLGTGSHVLAFVYDKDSKQLAAWVDGNPFFNNYITLSTSSANNYRIGQWIVVNDSQNQQWQSNFCAVYDRALTMQQIQLVSKKLLS